jgi:hypothetical protein
MNEAVRLDEPEISASRVSTRTVMLVLLEGDPSGVPLYSVCLLLLSKSKICDVR